ncbi:hypothetical protein E6O75_ATG10192 [Venturia nashicola]|uniref:Uncharacterized protein n=1 Tax=Venturia nashicola TaxID=86259 RepID=A0A4Z1NQ82_9PEZI|nr:hypothetical protein E6O75_ATG10192 [Venturia nashicola]
MARLWYGPRKEFMVSTCTAQATVNVRWDRLCVHMKKQLVFLQLNAGSGIHSVRLVQRVSGVGCRVPGVGCLVSGVFPEREEDSDQEDSAQEDSDLGDAERHLHDAKKGTTLRHNAAKTGGPGCEDRRARLRRQEGQAAKTGGPGCEDRRARLRRQESQAARGVGQETGEPTLRPSGFDGLISTEPS